MICKLNQDAATSRFSAGVPHFRAALVDKAPDVA